VEILNFLENLRELFLLSFLMHANSQRFSNEAWISRTGQTSKKTRGVFVYYLCICLRYVCMYSLWEWSRRSMWIARPRLNAHRTRTAGSSCARVTRTSPTSTTCRSSTDTSTRPSTARLSRDTFLVHSLYYFLVPFCTPCFGSLLHSFLDFSSHIQRGG